MDFINDSWQLFFLLTHSLFYFVSPYLSGESLSVKISHTDHSGIAPTYDNYPNYKNHTVVSIKIHAVPNKTP